MDNSTASGIGFFGALTLIFITLKLTGFIDWSWWWILAPTWIPIAIIVLILLGIIVYYLIKIIWN